MTLNPQVSGILKGCGFAGLGFFGAAGYFYPKLFGFLDGVNLLFHEAGHLFYSPFGEYLSIWGGTLLQLQTPFFLGIAFGWKKQVLSAGVMAWWFGENFSMISHYIRDARAQVLPYVGGEIHDWAFILQRHGVLRYDQEIGRAVWLFGLVLVMLSSFWGVRLSLAGRKV